MPPTSATLISNKRQLALLQLATHIEADVASSVFTSELLSYPNDIAKKEASSSIVRANRQFMRAIGSALGVSWSTNWTTTRTNIVSAINALSL